MAGKSSRKYLTFGAVVIVGALLIFAFWPQPLLVDIGEAAYGRLVISIDEEGRTRVHDSYIVSTPVAGRLLRLHVEPGDPVVGQKSVVAEMLPENPRLLDVRSLAEIRAQIAATEAALQAARAERSKAAADKKLADIELDRTRTLRKTRVLSPSALDLALREAQVTEAALLAAEAKIIMHKAELEGIRARLISFTGQEEADQTAGHDGQAVIIHAPASGQVLRLLHESETTLPAGTAIVEIGNIASDLEVVVELLSSDAVQVSPGDRVILWGWGGKENLGGTVKRIEPWGFTKVSALGVEEQRVNGIIGFTDPPAAWKKLGHGFRVEVKIVVWERENVLLVPSSALFRDGLDWAVFLVSDGAATMRHVQLGPNNGVSAQVLGGLASGDRVILYPAADVVDGIRVVEREIR
jgi:HlyD family secretion protein